MATIRVVDVPDRLAELVHGFVQEIRDAGHDVLVELLPPDAPADAGAPVRILDLPEEIRGLGERLGARLNGVGRTVKIEALPLGSGEWANRPAAEHTGGNAPTEPAEPAAAPATEPPTEPVPAPSTSTGPAAPPLTG